MINFDLYIWQLWSLLNELKDLIVSLIEENKILCDENKRLKLEYEKLKEKYSDLDY